MNAEQSKKHIAQDPEDSWSLPQSEKRRRFVKPTPENIRKYLEWNGEMLKLCKKKKPVRFIGDNWKM